ncbi:MAG: hypothetical protein FVQ82_08845 [Planctomycetes bacterium]|nr:hypothetical protein [Planctomycetota bacterium]
MSKEKRNSWVGWSDDEVKLLKQHFPNGNVRKVVELTGRPLTAVRQKAYDMGLKSGQRRPWTEEQIRQLRELFPSESLPSIAEILGVPLGSVIYKARQIGLRKTKAPVPPVKLAGGAMH